jgi:hypothetical protein
MSDKTSKKFRYGIATVSLVSGASEVPRHRRTVTARHLRPFSGGETLNIDGPQVNAAGGGGLSDRFRQLCYFSVHDLCNPILVESEPVGNTFKRSATLTA